MLKQLKKSFSQAGVKTCLLTFYQKEVAAFYTSPLLEQVGALPLTFKEGLSVLVDGNTGALFSETLTSSLNAPQFVQVISMANAGLTVEKRTLFQNLSLQQRGRVHAIIQDMDGNWWFCGQKRGLRLSYKADSDTGFSFSLSGREQEAARLVDPMLIPGFLNFLN